MEIAVYLHSRTVSCWRLTPAQAHALSHALSDARIVLCEDAETFAKAMRTATVALGWRFEQAWIDAAPKLRWIATPAAGRDYFGVELPERVTLTNGGFHGELMGETVLGMMLMHARGLLAAERLGRTDPWPRAALADRCRPLRGSRLTILGFGRIGRWVGRLAKPFGVRITGIRRGHGRRPEYMDARDHVLMVEELENALPHTDHLVLALPGTPETDHILDGRRLALLPDRAAVYNIGRGNAIDETALATALHKGALGGAYLDVFAEEPLPKEHPLRDAPGVYLMPHASAIAPNYLDLFLREFIHMFRAWEAAGGPEGRARPRLPDDL